jgi:hypothetical protein
MRQRGLVNMCAKSTTGGAINTCLFASGMDKTITQLACFLCPSPSTPPLAARAATSPELMKLSASMANTKATIPTAAALAVATELRPHITQLAPPAVRPQATLSTSAVICSTIPGNHHTPTCARHRCSSRGTRGETGGGGCQQKPQHASISMLQPGWQAPRPGYDGACSRVLEPLMHQTVDAPMLAKAYAFHDVTHQHLSNTMPNNATTRHLRKQLPAGAPQEVSPCPAGC